MILKFLGSEGWTFIDNITKAYIELDGSNSDGGFPTSNLFYLVGDESEYKRVVMERKYAYLLNNEGKTIENLRYVAKESKVSEKCGSSEKSVY